MKAGQNFLFATGQSHLRRIGIVEWHEDLILKSSEIGIVPSQSGVIGYVCQRHGRAGMDAAVDACRPSPPVGKGTLRFMTAGAGYGAVTRQSRIEKQQTPKFHLIRRHRIVRRYAGKGKSFGQFPSVSQVFYLAVAHRLLIKFTAARDQRQQNKKQEWFEGSYHDLAKPSRPSGSSPDAIAAWRASASVRSKPVSVRWSSRAFSSWPISMCKTPLYM